MFDEVKRVLSHETRGRYIVVTLGQDFILRKLLEVFQARDGGDNWQLVFHTFDNHRPSPFLGLIVVATRSSSSTSTVRLHIDGMARATESPALEVPLDASTIQDVMTSVAQVQRMYNIKHQIRKSVVPGRFLPGIDIWGSGTGVSNSKPSSHSGPRYTLQIVDCAPSSNTPLVCGVFLIPQGREHEWIFSSEDGLKQVRRE